MGIQPSKGRLYGRGDERRRLDAAVSATGDDPRGVILTGGSGIGKTRLLTEVVAAAQRNGSITLWGSCLDIGDAWPLHPLKEAALTLRNTEAVPQADRLLDILEGRAPRPEGQDVLAAVHAELTRLMTYRHTVFVLDDLQWLDSSTKRLILTLFSALNSGSMTFLSALRTGDTPRPLTLLADFHRSPLFDVIELGPLDEAASIDLARSEASTPVNKKIAVELWRRSGGVPLLVKELAKHTGAGPPPGLRDLLGARIASLPPGAQQVVRVASLGPGAVDHDVITAALDVSDDELIASARVAVEAGVLQATDTGYGPVHDLFREVAVGDLLEPERALLHGRIANALEARTNGDDTDPIELAHHWAGAGRNEHALRSFVAAARQATSIGANVEAWRHWQSAIGLLPRSPQRDRATLLAEAAESAHQCDDHEEANRLITEAELLVRTAENIAADGTDCTDVDRPHRTRLQLARSRYLAAGGELEAAQRLAASLFEGGAKTTDDTMEAGARSADLLARIGRYEDSASAAASVLALRADAQSNDAAVLLATAALGYSQACLGDPEVGRKSLADAVDLAARSGRAELIEAAGRHYADLLMGPLNELEAGIAVAQEQAAALMESGADPRFTTSLLAAATTGLFRLGRWQDAAKAATAALEADPTGAGAVDLLLGRARVVLGLGDFVTAEQDLDAAAILIGTEPNLRQYLQYATLRAGLAMWRNQPAIARETVASAIDRIDTDRFDDPWLLAPLVWHGLRAEAIAADHDEPTEPAIAARLASIMTRIRIEASVTDPGHADLLNAYELLCTGELDRVNGTRDADVWDRAAQSWVRCGHPYPAAYARLREATVLFAERTRNSRATASLQEAHRTAEGLSAGPLVGEIVDLARRAKVNLQVNPDPEPHDPAPSGPASALDDLTSRERDVIAELAKGLSNRQIGDKLFISGRTVGVHVSNILTKLGVRTRVEAAAIYARAVESDAVPIPDAH